MAEKPKLYLDIDGVLFGIYGGYMQPRANIHGFLRFCIEHFECRWLSIGWTQHRIESFLLHSYGTDIIPHISYHSLENYDSDRKNKADCIDLTEDFYWIEDGLFPAELKVLKKAGKQDRYIEVNRYGANELNRIQQILFAKLNLRTKEAHRERKNKLEKGHL